MRLLAGVFETLLPTSREEALSGVLLPPPYVCLCPTGLNRPPQQQSSGCSQSCHKRWNNTFQSVPTPKGGSFHGMWCFHELKRYDIVSFGSDRYCTWCLEAPGTAPEVRLLLALDLSCF